MHWVEAKSSSLLYMEFKDANIRRLDNSQEELFPRYRILMFWIADLWNFRIFSIPLTSCCPRWCRPYPSLPTLPFCPPFTFFLSLPMSSFPSFSLAFRPSYAPPFLNMLYFIVSDRRSNVFQVLVESRFLDFISRYSSETNNRYGNKRSIKQRFGDNYFSISLRRKF